MEKRGRIVLVVPEFPQLSETFIVSKFLGLLRFGWDVHVVCARSRREQMAAYPELQQQEIRRRIHTMWPVRPRWLAGASAPLAVAACAAREPGTTRRFLEHGWPSFGGGTLRRLYLDAQIVELNPDVVHFEFGALAPSRMYLRTLVGCRVVVSFRGYDINYAGLEQHGFYDPVWERADALHLLSEALWRRAQQRGCPPGKEHVLIPPAVDTSYYEMEEPRAAVEVGTAERPLRVLSVGRLEWTKGYEFALQAVRLLIDRGVHCEYTIVGDGAYRETVGFARHQLGLDEHVTMAGALPRPAVRDRMARADVMLHAAVAEGFCNAVLEGQSMMLPVVCSDADGLPENVVDGVTGFVVPRRDPEAFALKLALLAADPQLRARLGRAGRERVAERFQVQGQIAAFSEWYRRVLSDGEHDATSSYDTVSPDETYRLV